jgi:predicted amidophosphoribosyltransferase
MLGMRTEAEKTHPSFQLGWFRCEKCHRMRPLSQRRWRSPYERGFGVCRECYEAWERLGRRCPRCWRQVAPDEALAFLTERNTFGHFFCGGALLA